MDSSIATKAHDWLPGWIGKYWEVDHGSPYLKGAGMIRRPDVITVLDPAKPPTQENIKQVVEIKFPPDKITTPQQNAYIEIAGDEKKLVTIGPQDCDCNQPEPEESKVPVEELGIAATALRILYMLVTKRPPPGGVPVPAF
ncbi:VRR-NUC domain-containing protein [Herbaspirillum huttiense]